MIVSETWSRGRRRSIACRRRDREQGPRRQEEDGGADQALPGRPQPSRSPHIFCSEINLGEQRDGWGAAGQVLVGAAVFLLPPLSLLAVSPATSCGTPSPLLHVSLTITLRQTVSIPELPVSRVTNEQADRSIFERLYIHNQTC